MDGMLSQEEIAALLRGFEAEEDKAKESEDNEFEVSGREMDDLGYDEIEEGTYLSKEDIEQRIDYYSKTLQLNSFDKETEDYQRMKGALDYARDLIERDDYDERFSNDDGIQEDLRMIFNDLESYTNDIIMSEMESNLGRQDSGTDREAEKIPEPSGTVKFDEASKQGFSIEEVQNKIDYYRNIVHKIYNTASNEYEEAVYSFNYIENLLYSKDNPEEYLANNIDVQDKIKLELQSLEHIDADYQNYLENEEKLAGNGDGSEEPRKSQQENHGDNETGENNDSIINGSRSADDYGPEDFMNFDNDKMQEWGIRFSNELHTKFTNKVFRRMPEDKAYDDMEKALDSIKKQLSELYQKRKSNKNVDKKLEDSIKYCETMQNSLQAKMFSKYPIRLMRGGENFSSSHDNEFGKWAIEVLCYDAYMDKLNEFKTRQAAELQEASLEPDQQIKAQKEERAEAYSKAIEVIEAKLDTERYRNIEGNRAYQLAHGKIDISESEIPQEHEKYFNDFSAKVREMQERQVTLLTLKELKKITPKENDELTKLARDLRIAYKHMSVLRKMPKMLENFKGIEKMELKDSTMRISGKEIYDALTRKEKRYIAKDMKIKDKAKNQKSSHPKWMRKKRLHLPKKVNERIIDYIDSEECDLDRLIGMTKEELAVKVQAKKIAKEMRKAEKNKSRKKSDEKEPVEITKKFSDDPKINEILEIYSRLPKKSQIEVYVKTYGLDENGKEILEIFARLPKEEQKELYGKLFGNKDKEKDTIIGGN